MRKFITVILMLGMVVICSDLAFADLDDGLVAYFPLNTNANDASGNAYHGSEYGGIVYVDSPMGGAAEFDGLNDYIDIPYRAAIEPTIFTISLWVKSDKQAIQSILNTDPDAVNSGGHGYGIKISQDGFSQFYTDSSAYSGGVKTINSANVINDEDWHHVVVVYDTDNTLSMYVDNFFQPNMAANGYAKTHWSIRIGMRRCTTDISLRTYLDGCVDEVRIYNRVLTEPEIEQLYNEPQLLADAGPDQIVYDEVTLDGSQSNDPNGTITSYNWALNHRGNSANDRIAEGVNPTVEDLAPGFYDVTLTVENDSETVNTDNMVVGSIGCKGDFNCDGGIDGSDLAEFSDYFGRMDCPSCQ